MYIIWTSILIPLLVIAGIAIYDKSRLSSGEAAAIVLVPVTLSVSFYIFSYYFLISDTEYWGGHALEAVYYEDWDEEVPCSHPQYCTRTVSDGKSVKTETYQCGWQHLYDVDYHPEHWIINNNIGERFYIPQKHFDFLAGKWGNKEFKDMHRSYHINDGDAYISTFTGYIEPTTTAHFYENRIQSSTSLFNFKEIDNIDGKLFEYPDINRHYQKSLLGVDNDDIDFKIQQLNGKLGKDYQIKVFVLVWENGAMQDAIDQQSYWKGGNKNELIINIGTKNNKVEWGYVFSWTDSETIKTNTQNKIIEYKGNSFNYNEFILWLESEVKSNWKRKEFADFAYISVDIPTGWAITTFILTILTSGGIGAFSVLHNE